MDDYKIWEPLPRGWSGFHVFPCQQKEKGPVLSSADAKSEQQQQANEHILKLQEWPWSYQSCRNHWVTPQITNMNNRVVLKVRTREHQYPEFGHKQGKIEKNVQKSTLAFSEFHPVFLFSWAPSQLLHLFSLLLHVQVHTIMPLGPCALNVEFRHFTLSFKKISLLYTYHQRRG